MHGRHTNLDQRATQRDGTGPTRDRGRLHRHRALVSVAVLSAALLTACSDEGSSVRAADAATPANTTSPTTAATSAPVTPITSVTPATSVAFTSPEPPTSSGAPLMSVADLLDAVASTESDIGPGIDYVTDQVGQGRYDAGYRRRQESIEACSSIERPLLHGATYAESVDGRGWLYLDLESPQRPYVAHSVLVLTDERAAQDVMTDLRAAADLPTCVAEWVAAVNGEDGAAKNAPWASASIDYSALDARFAEPLDGLGEDQLSVRWQQRLSIDGSETAPEEMTFHMARFGAVIFTFSGNGPDRTAATAVVLAERLASSIGSDMGVAGPASDEERIATVRARRQAMAEAALLRPDDLGDDWQDLGPASVFPMTSALAASLPSCTSFVEPVFEDDDGVWAHRALGRGADVAFTSVTVFATEADAAAMVAATAEPAFDQCWADFNEVAVVGLGFGVESADYASVDPPDIELGGDSSSLQALEGTVTFGSTSFPDTCICAFVQQGRTVVTFHAAAHVFGAAERHDLIVAATARIDDEVE